MKLKCFASFFSNRKRFVSIREFNSHLGDLHLVIKYSEEHHVSDKTNLLSLSSCVYFIHKQVNCDLQNLLKCLRASKISLNNSRAEILLLTSL